MGYKVVYAQSLTDSGVLKKLEEEVNKLLEDGYKPQGGIAVAKTDDSDWITLYQAMIKE